MSDTPPPPPPPSDPHPQAHEGYVPPSSATGWASLGNGHVVELASTLQRFGARVLDFFIVFGASVVFLLIAFAVIVSSSGSGGLVFILFVAILIIIFGLAYEVTMIALKGQTLGKMAAGIKVVRADNGEIVGWSKSIARWIVPAVLSLIPTIGPILSLIVYISFLWDSTRQGWHDKLAGTLVIKV
ncbi:MAG: RDD family protein [Acidimicrobiia bacterium]|nr:RDD family protein [Acidimicrobiia bacterium]MCY4458212.1 RDD family protein [Acidimicrobiaceae bacterium]